MQTDNFFMLNKSKKQNNFAFLFLKLITHKNAEEKKCLFCNNKMEMKNNPICCTLKLSGQSAPSSLELSGTGNIYVSQMNGRFLSHGRASMAVSQGWLLDPPFKNVKNHIRDLFHLKGNAKVKGQH